MTTTVSPFGTGSLLHQLMLKARRSAAMFWLYWDTAWSIEFGGIMFATIVAHPDAEFIEIQLQSRAYRRIRDL